MSVLIYEPDAFDKMCQVEGEEYRKFKSKEEFGDCSFDAFLEKWQEVDAKTKFWGVNFSDESLDCPGLGIKVNDTCVIYGLGGWNRYVVTLRGEIMMIESQVPVKNYIELAKRVGFRTF